MEDNNFESEFGAHLRTSSEDPLLAALKNTKVKDRSPDEHFRVLVDGIFYNLIQNGLSFISNNDKEFVMNNISKLDKSGSKNSLGYVLGFYASTYDDKTMKIIFDSLDTINNLSYKYPFYSIKKPDIIRYARLWNKINF